MENKNIKVLIATGIYPPEIGGPSMMIGALVDSLGRIGFDFKIITYSKNEIQKNDSICRIRSGKTFSYIKYLVAIIRRSFWADIIYATDTYSVGYFAYLMKIFFRKK